MTRTLVPLAAPDVSAFAKSLKRLLEERLLAGKSATPSHLEMLNLVARAAGVRNFSTLKATADKPKPELTPTARKALIQFDEQGRLVRLANKLSVQQMTVWALWTQFAAKRDYTEKEVNAILNAHHTFRPGLAAPRDGGDGAARAPVRLQPLLEGSAPAAAGRAGLPHRVATCGAKRCLNQSSSMRFS